MGWYFDDSDSPGFWDWRPNSCDRELPNCTPRWKNTGERFLEMQFWHLIQVVTYEVHPVRGYEAKVATNKNQNKTYFDLKIISRCPTRALLR